jgi:hypothetical protein
MDDDGFGAEGRGLIYHGATNATNMTIQYDDTTHACHCSGGKYIGA